MEIRRTLSTDELLKRKRTNEKVQKIFVKIFIFFVLILMDLPIFYLIVNSFTTARITGTWNGFSMIPYQTLFNYAGNKYAQKIWNACGNTILVALVAGALATVVGTAGAIGTHYMKRKWIKSTFSFVNQIPVVNAEIVMAISLCILFVSMHWPRTFITLIIGHMVLTLPFVVLSVEPKLEQMDNSLFEAALDLGATESEAIFKVMIPDILPGIISGFLLSVTLSLDDYIITAFTKPGQGFDTISTYVEAVTKKESLPIQLRAFTTVLFIIVMGVMFIISMKLKKRSER
ncbi:MAG: ABC transporter permease [Anaeroplasma sp.]|uniref:ABC transporter permease n=1 Tax=Anaeroplasma sp. TaxID=1872523 RepID=UPI002A91567F|nr:ABC transporter permease [Anaeroplasma sp.]MDY5982989.1 ABC transporter permease [Anaeroplasma sp.]